MKRKTNTVNKKKKKPKICSVCRGKGLVPLKCPVCKGDEYKECKTCNNTGLFNWMCGVCEKETEAEIQKMYMAYMKCFHNDKLLTSNGNFRSQKQSGFAMNMGYLKGIPDTQLIQPVGNYHGMFIEFKKPGGSLSDEQITILKRLYKEGYCVGIFKNPIKAIQFTEDYLEGKEVKRIVCDDYGFSKKVNVC